MDNKQIGEKNVKKSDKNLDNEWMKEKNAYNICKKFCWSMYNKQIGEKNVKKSDKNLENEWMNEKNACNICKKFCWSVMMCWYSALSTLLLKKLDC